MERFRSFDFQYLDLVGPRTGHGPPKRVATSQVEIRVSSRRCLYSGWGALSSSIRLPMALLAADHFEIF